MYASVPTSVPVCVCGQCMLMSACVCQCAHLYVCTCVHVCTLVSVCICMLMHRSVCVFCILCTCHVCACLSTDLCVCIHVCVCTLSALCMFWKWLPDKNPGFQVFQVPACHSGCGCQALAWCTGWVCQQGLAECSPWPLIGSADTWGQLQCPPSLCLRKLRSHRKMPVE